MKGYKKGIVVFGLLAMVYAGIIFIVYSQKDTPTNNTVTPTDAIDSKYLSYKNESVWSYTDSWYKTSNSSISGKKMNCYVDRSYFGQYKVKYINNWNLFDENDNYVDYQGDLILTSSGFEISLPIYVKSNINNSDLIEINKHIKSETTIDKLVNSYSIIADFNNDNILDKLVIASNADLYREETNYFNLVYVIINDEFYEIINESYEPASVMSAPTYDFREVFNLKDVNYSNIIIHKDCFSNTCTSGNALFGHVDKAYKQLVKP